MAIEHTFISKDGEKTSENHTRGKAIREKCMECCVWQTKEVRLCPSKDCALHPYRMETIAAGLKANAKL